MIVVFTEGDGNLVVGAINTETEEIIVRDGYKSRVFEDSKLPSFCMDGQDIYLVENTMYTKIK